jgi:hypothetical protein
MGAATGRYAPKARDEHGNDSRIPLGSEIRRPRARRIEE